MSHSVAELPRKEPRNIAVDAYRGFVMVLMMAEVLQFAYVARSFPGNPVWQFLGTEQTHVPWTGMSLHDSIQPGFTFLAGVALPYSLASRKRKGESFRHMLFHVVWRSLLLIALGIFLRSTAKPITYFTFEDTLTQIGLGYTFAFLIAFLKPRWQWISLAAILFAYWLAWALYPAPGPDFNWAAVGVPPDFHLLRGFAAHWNKNSNLGQAVDVWFLNLFPRTAPFAYNAGGYLTLSFIPTLGTLAPRTHHGPLVSRGRSQDSIPPPLGDRRDFVRRGAAAALYRHLPDRQADLDPFLDPFLGRRMHVLSRCILVGRGREKPSSARVSTGRGGHELPRRLRHCRSLRGLR